MVERSDIWLSQCQDPDHGAIFWEILWELRAIFGTLSLVVTIS